MSEDANSNNVSSTTSNPEPSINDIAGCNLDEAKKVLKKSIEDEGKVGVTELDNGFDVTFWRNPNGEIIKNHSGGDPYSNSTEYPRGIVLETYDMDSRLNLDGIRPSLDDDMKTSEVQALEDMTSLIGDITSAKGINLQDTIRANMFYYNKTGKELLLDPPEIGKTYVFFTRPDLNLCKANIDSDPLFKWLFARQYGKELMSMLTGPDRAVYGDISGFTKDELAKEKYDLTSQNPIDFVIDNSKNIQELAKMGTDTLNGVFEKHFYDQYEWLKTNVKGVMDSFYNVAQNVKEAPQKLAQMGNDILTKMENSGKWGEFASSVVRGAGNLLNGDESLEKEPLVENTDPIKNVGTDEEFIAKYIPKFFNWGPSKSWGNTKRNPRTRTDEKMVFNSPFIPMLSNNCKSVPSGKDTVIGTFEYPEDFRGHKPIVPTGGNEINGNGELSITFRDNRANLVKWLFKIWTRYIEGCGSGEFIPRWSNIVERVSDYTCSIYVFVIGKDGMSIISWCKYTGCFPVSFPHNWIFHQATDLDSQSLSEVTISFQYNIYEALNPEIFTDFNFLSETEWRRKVNLDHNYFSIDRTGEILNNMIDPAQIWSYIPYDEVTSSISGQVPIKSLPGRLDTTLFGHYKRWQAQNPTDAEYSNHYGGYPYIINGGSHFVWINPKRALKLLDTKDKPNLLPNETKLTIA